MCCKKCVIVLITFFALETFTCLLFHYLILFFEIYHDFFSIRVVVRRWKERWDPTSLPFPHGGREETFLNFPSHMKKK